MNFLQQLASEWYRHEGYFIRTNVKALKRLKGGWDAELDVLGYDPLNGALLHVETSADAHSWTERKRSFIKKFLIDRTEYEKILGAKFKTIRKIAIVGYGRSTKADLKWDQSIEVVLIPEFIRQVAATLRSQRFMREAIPEGYPMLRTIQMVLAYGI